METDLYAHTQIVSLKIMVQTLKQLMAELSPDPSFLTRYQSIYLQKLNTLIEGLSKDSKIVPEVLAMLEDLKKEA